MSGQVICTPGLALPSAGATSLRSSRSKPALVLAVSHRRGVPMAPLSQVIATRGASTTRPAAFEDASVADAVASAPAPDDPIVSVMFTLAVVALSVLTLGVAYLSISSFLDQRQEEEDRKRAGYGPSKTDAMGVPRPGSGPPSTTFDESAFEAGSGSGKKKRKAPKKKSDKGFGTN